MIKTPAALLGVLLGVLALGSSAAAQPKVRINWSATAVGQSGLWIAYEEGFYKKHGLDVELTHIPSSSRAIQTMLAGEIAFTAVDVLNSIQANLRGADVVIIAGIYNRFPFYLMGRAELRTLNDEAVHLIKTNKAVTFKHFQKYLKVTDPEVLEDAYRQNDDPLENIPNVNREGLVTLLAELAKEEPKARQAKPEDFLEMRFVRELEREGVFRHLWGPR